MFKKLVKNNGNSLTTTIIFVFVLSTIALGIALVVGLTAKVRLNSLTNKSNSVILENTMYDFLIDFIDNDMHYTTNTRTDGLILEDVYEYEYMSVYDNVNDKYNVVIKLRKNSFSNALETTIEIDDDLRAYSIKKWGITKWE